MEKFVPQNALLFVPDISGFTQFINNRELQHLHYLIAELLEILIESNRINLKVHEIEGDAILFYRLGESPSVSEIVEQSRNMYIAFHKHLKKYGVSRICNCAVCSTVSKLTLKTIVHYGSLSFHKIQDREKIFGPDVIKVHRLLKNDIPYNEYILLTESLEKETSTDKIENWVSWEKGSTSYDVGEVTYRYTSLQPVYSQVPEPKLGEVKIYKSKSPFVFGVEIDVRMDIVYESLIDLNQRVHWMTGVKAVKIKNESLNRMNKICTSFECLMEHEKCTFQTSSVKFGEGNVNFSETYLEHPMTFNYLIEGIDNKTKLTLECHNAFNLPMRWLFNLFMKRKFKADILKSLSRLKTYCEQKAN